MTDEEAINIGLRASGELELTQQAFEGLKATILQEIIETSWEQDAKRERLYVALKSLGMVRTALEQAVASGKVAGNMQNYKAQLAASGLTKP